MSNTALHNGWVRSAALVIGSALILLTTAAADGFAEEDYDPELNLQVPHQKILNNETLPANQGNSGAMTYAIPIKVAPGRNGLQPSLQLTYNSQRRQNTWVGVGWDLNLGYIERSKKQRVNFSTSDAFSFNGNVDLVKRSQWGSDYYGPKIEEAFVKYRFLSSSDRWEAYHPDGRVYYYGSSSSSTQARLRTPEGTFRWLLYKIQDSNDNAMTVSYTQSSGDGIYPDTIGYSPSGSYVSFSLESRNDSSPSYGHYLLEKPSRRLEQIRCYGNGKLAHWYDLSYEYSSYSDRSVLTGVREYGSDSTADFPAITFDYTSSSTLGFDSYKSRTGNYLNYQGKNSFADINGDGCRDLIKFNPSTNDAHVFLWSKSSNGFSSYRTSDLSGTTSPEVIRFGDVNGDGKADCVIAQRTMGGGYARTYLGQSNGDLDYSGQALPLYTNLNMGLTQLADVNGDGMADLIDFPYGIAHVRVHLADGTGKFDTDYSETDLSKPTTVGHVFLADINGDGMADIIQTNELFCEVYVQLATGNGQFDTAVVSDSERTCEPGTIEFADVNGDGLSDMMLMPTGSNYVYAYLSNGLGGFATEVRTSTSYSNEPGYTLFGDVNGDGFDDMVKCRQNTTYSYLYLADGSGGFDYFGSRSTATNGFSTLADVNGDGRADLHRLKTSSSTVYTHLAKGLSSSVAGPDLLNEINNGYGVVSDIKYRVSTFLDDLHEPSSSYPKAFLPFPLDLVTSIVVDDSIGNTGITTGYTYKGAHYSIPEREIVGIGTIVQTNPNDTTLTRTFHVDDYYYKGREKKLDYEDDGSSDSLITNYSWTKYSLENRAVWVHPDEQTNDIRIGGGSVNYDVDFDYRYNSSYRFGYLYEKEISGDDASNLTIRTGTGKYGTWIWRVTSRQIRQGSTIARETSYQYDSDGNCTRETHENSSGSDAVISRSFDSYGNVVSEEDPNGNTTTFSYTDGTYLYKRDFEGLSRYYYSYNQWGKPGSMHDENSNTTSYAYDSYGRLTEEDFPGSDRTNIAYYDTSRPRYTVTTRYDGSSTSYSTRNYYDGLDRPLQTSVTGPSLSHKITRTWYDSAGRVTAVAGPFTQSSLGYYSSSSIPSGAPYTKFRYFNGFNQPELLESPTDTGSTAATTISYSGFDRTVTDPDGNSTTALRDYLGRVYKIVDAVNGSTSYETNGAGDLTRVINALGHSTTLTRNTLGHITTLADPDLGTWNFTYYPNGEIATRTDARNQRVTYSYDANNRLKSKVYSNVSPSESSVTYTYDSATNGKGRLYTVTKGSTSTRIDTYDGMGRVTKKTVTIDSQSFPFSYAYDPVGSLTKVIYPDGYTVTYDAHNGTSDLYTVDASGPTINVDFLDYTNFGKPGRIRYPFGETAMGYYSRTGRLKSISASGLMNLSCTYTSGGDLSSLQDTVRGFSATYQYDDLHRLTHESVTGPFHSEGSRSLTLDYGTSHAHAVSRVTESGFGQKAFSYDANGNLTKGYDFSSKGTFPSRSITFNAENMPATLTYTPETGDARTLGLTYDGNNRRVKKTTGTDTVLYVDDLYEIRNGQAVKYVFAKDMRLARVIGSDVHYYHRDHVGSTALMTDASGDVTDANAYAPFGQERGILCVPDSPDTAYTFTGQEYDAETGLYNYDARLYDPVLGRFITADSVVPDWLDPQSLDRYAYARNNPLKYVDPTGHANIEYGLDDEGNSYGGYGGLGIGNPGSHGGTTDLGSEAHGWGQEGYADAQLRKWAADNSFDYKAFAAGGEILGATGALGKAAKWAGSKFAGLFGKASKKIPSIKWGAQEKHFPGHNSYTPGRSTMTADPTKLAEKAGTGQQVGKIPVGQPGSKERINFGERIGTYIDQAGNSSPTANGIIHYSKDGIHIVPARP